MTELVLIPPKQFMTKEVLGPQKHVLIPWHFADDFPIEHFEAEKYIICDNGEPEGVPAPVSTLFQVARGIDANEIVVPDKLERPGTTLKLVQEFEAAVLTFDAKSWKDLTFKYMAVVQQMDSALATAWALVDAYLEMPWISCIGIPRAMVKHGYSTRNALATYIHERLKDVDRHVDIHYLGTYPGALEELKFIPDFVRSVDTSAPFNYAWHGIDLTREPFGRGIQATRPDDYMNASWDLDQQVLVEQNIKVLRGWLARAEAPTG